MASNPATVPSSVPFHHHVNQHGISYIASGTPQQSNLTIICIHGWGCEASNYSYLFAELSKSEFQYQYQTIAISLPGHGQSSKQYYPVADMKTFGEAIIDFIKDLQLYKVVLVGHSMGVRIILETWSQIKAAGESINVSGLVLLDGSNYSFRKSLFAFDSGDPRSKTMSKEEKRERVLEAFQRFFSSRTPQEFRESALNHVKNIDEDYSQASRQSFIKWDHERMDDVLAEIAASGIPVMNLQATDVDDETQRIPLEDGQVSQFMRYINEKLPQVEQHAVSDSGHFVQVDQPAVVASRIRDFVKSLA